ncbi:putative hydrolase of the HAD superfamily [Stigmatella aurantiaca]|uniref:Putative hydrolase of the HAD superfamily n=1 Tax=Stigmatella aurantiaca TaxID=41 RepID=A0A1H7QR72_STIAU|nr:HAD family hydrolase [Stigmatella aurantiaca]SEL50476.1 putative hydrolase of the HAD superfamily [Stigmatella aurantiaca]
MRPRAVFFDLDDTLIDRAGAFARYVDSLIERYPAAFPPSLRAGQVALIHDWDRRGGSDRSVFCRQVTAACPGLGLSPEALWEDMSSLLPRLVVPDDGVCAWLGAFTAGRPVAVVSNGSGRVQRTKLAQARLLEPLPDVFLSGEVGAEKPDPRIFQAALARVDRAPGEVLHVGDDPERDIAGAARLGLATCWVSHGREWPRELPPPTFTVERITTRIQDISEVLAQWT